jgi:hypothetical protein
VNRDNWPSDFVEACPDRRGKDSFNAYSTMLAVYSGHGHISLLAFSDLIMSRIT